MMRFFGGGRSKRRALTICCFLTTSSSSSPRSSLLLPPPAAAFVVNGFQQRRPPQLAFRAIAAAATAAATVATRSGGVAGGSAAPAPPNRSRSTCGAPSSTRRSASATMTSAVTDSAAAKAGASTPKYDALMMEIDQVTQLSRASAVLQYDEQVFMPHTDAASRERGKQSAALASAVHEKSTSERLGMLLGEAEEELKKLVNNGGSIDDEIARKVRNVEVARIDYAKKTCIPKELASEQAALKSESHSTWVKARSADDFSQFNDVLGRCVELSKKVAELQRGGMKGPAAERSLYETMLDDYETGMEASRIDAVFDEIKSSLVPLIDKVLGKDATPPSKAPLGGKGKKFEVDAQKDLCTTLARSIGFDDKSGRIDVSVHPFTMSMNPSDVRITSRFSEDEWYQGLAGTVHESGHAIYEQNLPKTSEPICEALSMGMHESQSLFWERHVGLSRPFWKYAAPIVNEKLGADHTAEEYYGAVNAASRSFIRVEADELTYPLHIILRYEIERDFVQGKLDVNDIPKRWNDDFERLLGLKVPSDAKGCLQDIHWSMLAYGYFPTYLIGSATAAQLAHYCRRDVPDFDAKIERGEFGEIKAWLTEKVHRHGKFYKSLDEHLEAQLGEKLNPAYFIEYLTNKYTEIYQVQ